MTLECSLGKIFKNDKSVQGYYKLIIAINVPFDTIWMQFEVYDGLSETFNKGDEIKFTYISEINPQLKHIEKITAKSCFICHAFYEIESSGELSCGMCKTVEKLDKHDKILRLTKLTVKDYFYFKGIKAIFKDEETCEILYCRVSDESPLFQEFLSLYVGKCYYTTGWKGIYTDRKFLELTDVPTFCG